MRKSEAGAISAIAGILIFVMLGFTGLAFDVGYFFYHQQKLQNSTDAAALAAVLDLDDSAGSAAETFSNNGIPVDALTTFLVETGNWDAATETFTANPAGLAVQVTAARPVESFFAQLFGIESFTPSARATAALRETGAVVSLGATVANVSINESLLGALIGNLLDLDLHLIGWRGLLEGEIDLVKFLNLAKIRLSVGDLDGLLDAQVTLAQMLDIAIEVLEAERYTARIEAALSSLRALKLEVAPLTTKIRLGDVIDLDVNKGALASANVNLFEMIRVMAAIFNFESGIRVDTNLNLVGLALTLKAKVIEPPVIKIMQEGSEIHSAAVRLYVNANLLGLVNLPLYLELGSGDATLTQITPDAVVLEGSSSAAKLFIGSINDRFFFSEETLDQNDFGPAKLLSVKLLGLEIAGATVKGFVNAMGSLEELTFTPPFPETQSVKGVLGRSVNNLSASLTENLDVRLTGAADALNDLLAALGVTGEDGLLDLIVGRILGPLLEPLLNAASLALGLFPGVADITVHDFAYKAVLVQ